MPSLARLEEFKTSFANLGGEARILAESNLPLTALDLPQDEPPSPFPAGLGEPGSEPAPAEFSPAAEPDTPAGPADAAPDPADTDLGDDFAGGDFDFGDLLGSGAPDDIPPAALPGEDGEAQTADMEPPPEEASGEPGDLDLGDLDLSDFDPDAAAEPDGGPEDLPQDLLSGFTEDLESGGLPVEEAGAGDAEPAGEPSGPAAESAAPEEDFSTPDLSGFEELGKEAGTGEEEDLDFPDFEESAFEAPGDAGLDLGGEDAGEDSGGLDLGGEEALEDEDASLDFPSVETADIAGPGDDSGGPADSFDNFDLSGDAAGPGDDSGPSADADDLGDFSLPGFDDALTGKGAGPRRAPGAGAAKKEVEEVALSEDEYKSLQDTLSAYPLNLRVACEELIAEQAVTPDLMSALIKLLVRGAPARETAGLAGKILGRSIPIPRGYAKQTGAELEAEQASFGYIFVHRFLPVLRLVGAAALVLISLGYLTWRFVIVPFQAESLYKEGYASLQSGEYGRANEIFLRAFGKRRVKNWFYRYAEGFRDERQYLYAERKYDELLRVYPRDKKGALDYAGLETNYLKNHAKADRIIRDNILDYAPNDREGLFALGENNLAWGEIEPSRYEEARASFARLMELYGRQDLFLEGMLKYFIRTDNLNEVLPLHSHFMSDPRKRKIAVPTLAELGGYLLDKRFEESTGVPEEYADQIEGIGEVLLRAIENDSTYPESYYHLARYYHNYESPGEERQALRAAIKAFAAAREETSRRAGYRVDTHRRYAEALINAREFFPAEEELIRGVRLYEDARARQVLKTQSEFGRLYADLGDLEFFVKDGDMAAALRFYQEGERNGWAPPEIQYRMGTAHYQLEQWEDALQRFFAVLPAMPNNKRLLYALGNVSYLRGNYFAAQSYYNRLMDILSADRVRFPDLAPGAKPEGQDLTERIMVADNNLGVTLEALTQISGDTSYRSRALGLFSESIRAWDVLTRNPESMTRMRPFKDLYGPGINLAYLNAQNIIRPEPNYEPQIFMRIDRDALEPSAWESLIPRDYQLSDQLVSMPVE
ncbi:MAG: tetratricopeptide repeat protein [Treponema sp.]|jgi:tetratricopeptide (TPR) repeat protein|nr:tetratricopeptide repeat protein [Treponema sp.]